MNNEVDITKQQASRHLGNSVVYTDQYDAGLLVPIERVHNRVKYGIDNADLPFVGYDTWNAYEVSFLLENGFPVSCVAKIVYPADSEFIVESKSIKLYLNSFNMSRYPGTREEASRVVEKIIAKDLSEALKTTVKVFFHFTETNAPIWSKHSYDSFMELEEIVDAESLEFTQFNESPDTLVPETNPEYGNTLRVHSTSLRSQCRLTNQPDWGDVYIHIEGDSVPTAESLLQYLVSFRKESHFHEECVEMIYARLWDKFKPTELMVTAVYTRRGGIDICPSRATHVELLSKNLGDHKVHVNKTLRQ